MCNIYQQPSLVEEDERELAKLMRNMRSVCQARQEGLDTVEEQRRFIDSLSVTEKSQIETQIQMYLDCRKYHFKYYRWYNNI